jgi:glycosyl transferase family 87
MDSGWQWDGRNRGGCFMAPKSSGNNWKLFAAIGGLCGLFAYFFTIAFRRIVTRRFSDFSVFYSAAQAMLRHGDPYVPQHRSYIYPPLIAFLYMPLALMSEPHAAMIVLFANILFILIALLLIAHESLWRLDLPHHLLAVITVALVAVLLVPDKVKNELQMFQTNGLMLLMLALALRWLDRKPLLCGIALGFACNIKYLPLVLLPWLLIRRRWQAAASCILSCIFFALLPAVQSGWKDNLTHLSTAFGGLGHLVGIDTQSAQSADIWNMRAGVSLSITSAIARITHRAKSEALMLPIVLAIAAVVLAATAAIYRRRAIPFLRWPAAAEQSAQPFRSVVPMEWAALIALALVFSPQTNSRHLVLLLLATTIFSCMLLHPRKGIPIYPLLIAAAVLLLGLTFPWGGTLTDFAHQSRLWFTWGGQGWCVLLIYFLLVNSGLHYAKSLAPQTLFAISSPISESQMSRGVLQPG